MTPAHALAATWRLSGKVLKKEHNSFDRDYSGGSAYSENSVSVYLYEDKSFLYERKSFSSLSGGGFSLPSESHDREEGRWKVEATEAGAVLILRRADGSVFQSWAVKDGGRGVEYLDGEAWGRCRIG
jgi:hypothetical protein